MARFFVWSHEGNGLSLALRLKRQGHRVRYYSELPHAENGLVSVTHSLQPERDEVVLFDDVGGARLGQLWRRQGFPTFGGHPLEVWETKREVGTRIMQEYGIQTPETHVFNSLQDARKFLRKEDDFWYFKPDGKDIPKHLTYGEESEFLLRWLDYAEPQLQKVPRFQLQRRVEGTEIDCCLWINQQAVVAAEATIEEKKYGTGNTGPSTGCQANLCWSVPVDGPLVEATIGHFIGPLQEAAYVGLAALNCIITPDGTVYGIEFTMRFGYDSTQASMLLWGDDFGEQLDAFTRGNLWKFERAEDRYAMTLRLSTLPQPVVHLKGKEFEGIPLDPKLLEDPDFFPDALKLNREARPVTLGNEGYVGVIGTTGVDLSLMRENLVRRAGEFKIPYKHNRLDPVSRAESTLSFLASQGLAERLRPAEPPAIHVHVERPALPVRGGYPPPSRDYPLDDISPSGSSPSPAVSGGEPRVT
jgi:phosphoribosylamine-glycine ligase